MPLSENIVIRKCKQAGVSFWIASKAAMMLKGKLSSNLSDLEVNRRILGVLRKINEEAALQFESYHSIEVRTSGNVLETFNRDKIVQSLLRETRIPKAVAEEIALEVEKEIRRAQLKNISSALIRELVNANLLERKLVKAQNNYTRAGIPVYDIKNIIEGSSINNPFELSELFGREVLEDFVLTKVLPEKISKAHLDSSIHIHALEYFSISPYALQNDLRAFLKHGFMLPGVVRTSPAKKADVAMSHAARILFVSRQFVASGVGFDFFNIFLAPYMPKKKQQIEQVCQTFLYELNWRTDIDSAFTINLDLKIPDFLKKEEAIGPGGEVVGRYKDFEEEAKNLAEVFIKTFNKGDYAKQRFKFPEIALKNYGGRIKHELPRPTYVIKQDTKNSSVLFGNVLQTNGLTGLGSGILQKVSINMIKIAKRSKDEKEFYDNIGEILDLTKEVMLKKREEVKQRIYKNKLLSFLGQIIDGEEYADVDKFKCIDALVGLPQATKLFLQKEKYDLDCLILSERVLRFVRRKFREYKREEGLSFAVSDKTSMTALTRFTSENKKEGINIDISEGFLPQELDEKQRKEAAERLQQLFNAGAFLEIQSKKLPEYKDFLFLKVF